MLNFRIITVLGLGRRRTVEVPTGIRTDVGGRFRVIAETTDSEGENKAHEDTTVALQELEERRLSRAPDRGLPDPIRLPRRPLRVRG